MSQWAYLDLCLGNLTILRKPVQAQLGVAPLGEGHQAVHEPSPLPGCCGAVDEIPLELQLPQTTLLYRLQRGKNQHSKESSVLKGMKKADHKLQPTK